MDDLLADFLTETQEGLVALDAAMVRLERAPGDRGTMAEVFRVVHTIKGTCGFLGLPRLEAVAHAAENVLGRWRDGSMPVTQEGISLILRSLDAMRHVVSALEGLGREPAGDDAALIAALNAAAEGLAAAAAPEVSSPDADGAAAAAPVDAAPPVAATAPAAAPEEAPGAGALSAPQTIRVAVEVLEDLMTLVSELVLTRNQLLQLARGGADAGFAAPLQRLSQITSELQEGVMKTRM